MAAFLIAVLISAAPVRAADPAILADARALAQICQDHFPDARAVRAAFKAAGLRDEGIYGSYYLFSMRNHRIYAGIAATRTSDPDPECFIVVKSMTLGEAEALAGGWKKAIGARKAKTSRKDVASVHFGNLKGLPTAIYVIREIDLYYLKAPAIVLETNLTVKKQ